MRTVLWVLVGFAALGFFASFGFEAIFLARSTKVQLVKRDPREAGRWITMGDPFEVVDVPEAAVVEKGRDEIAALVDAGALRKAGPTLTLETIRRYAWIGRLGALLAISYLLFGMWLLKSRRVSAS